jgi:transposase-like protein
MQPTDFVSQRASVASPQVMPDNNRIEQDHRGIKGRYQPMRGFKSSASAARFCRSYDELRNCFRLRSNRNQPVPANHRRLHVLSRSLTALSILRAA